MDPLHIDTPMPVDQMFVNPSRILVTLDIENPIIIPIDDIAGSD